MTCGTSTTTTGEPDGSDANPFIAKQGRTFKLRATARDLETGNTIDLTNPQRTGRSHMRRYPTATGPPDAILSVALLDQTTKRGQADVTLGATAVADLIPGQYSLDVEFENDIDPNDVIATDVARVLVTLEITR